MRISFDINIKAVLAVVAGVAIAAGSFFAGRHQEHAHGEAVKFFAMVDQHGGAYVETGGHIVFGTPAQIKESCPDFNVPTGYVPDEPEPCAEHNADDPYLAYGGHAVDPYTGAYWDKYKVPAVIPAGKDAWEQTAAIMKFCKERPSATYVSGQPWEKNYQSGTCTAAGETGGQQ
jgi:hypothetical protein